MVCSRAMPSTPSCTLAAEQELGPYYIDDEKLRQDITEGRPGLPLRLRVALVDAQRCMPLQNAALDIWHCDALGVYSGFTTNSPDGSAGVSRNPGGPDRMRRPPARQIDETRFLRGVQATDKAGMVEFLTLYPGWYSGRAIHIHLKVHTGGHVSHTGQLFFPEEVTQDVLKMEPYAKRLAVHRTLQSEDGIFKSQHGGDSMLSLSRLTPGSNAEGFLATATLAVDPAATPAPVRGFGPGLGGPGPSQR